MKTYLPPEIATLVEAVRAALPSDMRRVRALDVGCGDGTFGRLLLEKGADVTFLDVVGAAESALSARLAGLTNWTFRCGGIESMTKERFSFVTFFLSLHHIKDSLGALRQAVALTDHGGRIVVCDFLPNDLPFHRERVPHEGFDPEDLVASISDSRVAAAALRQLPSISKDGHDFPIFMLSLTKK